MNLWHMLCQGLGFIISNTYFAVKNYGLAIIIFTVIVKIIFFPLTYKQQRSMFELRKIQPMLDDLNKKYKDDKQKLNTEIFNLYKEHNINPMAGCLPSLIQLPVIIALFDVVTKPMIYMFGFTQQNVADVQAALGLQDVAKVSQLTLMTELANRGSEFISSLNLPAFQVVDFDFLGLNLAENPSIFSFSPLWIIPILSGISTWVASKTMNTSMHDSDTDNPMAQSQNSMLVMMPFMTAYFAFNFPAGVGFYWIINNIIQIVQQIYFNYVFEKYHPKLGKASISSDKGDAIGLNMVSLPSSGGSDKDKGSKSDGSMDGARGASNQTNHKSEGSKNNNGNRNKKGKGRKNRKKNS